MNKTLLCSAVLATSALSLSAQESLSPFVSYSGGYLLDSEEALHTARVGVSSGCARYFVQVGFSDTEETIFRNKQEADFTSISLGAMGNHYYDSRFSIYYGASAGIAEFDFDFRFNNQSFSDDDNSFYFDVFAGFEYALNEHVSVNAGARYLFADDISAFGESLDSLDDVSIEAGLTVTF